jgi:hypothetical protein
VIFIQVEVQDFCWNSAQAVFHPFVTYYSQSEMTEHISFVLITDCLKHGTVAVHLFQSTLFSFLSGKLNDLTKSCCFSDGAASQ